MIPILAIYVVTMREGKEEKHRDLSGILLLN